MKSQLKVYVAQDHYLVAELDEVAAALAAGGWEVVRGPQSRPGVRVQLSADQRAAYLADIDVMVISSRSKVHRDDLEYSERLRAVMFPTIGVDAVDLADCNELGLVVGHGPTPENFQSMAEATCMLILASLYNLQLSEKVLRQNLPRPAAPPARMLKGKTIGLLGLGRIGAAVLERLRPWGVSFQVHDPFLASGQAPADAELVDMDTLLATSDVVSLHVPYNANNHRLIGEAELRRMKGDAVLVNTSRGGLVDENALYRIMTDGHLLAAALDVSEIEPLPADSPLRKLDRVILTPHMVGHTKEIFDQIAPTLIENLRLVGEGDSPVYVRNPEVMDKWQARLSDIG